MADKKKEATPRDSIPGSGPPTKAGLGTEAAGSDRQKQPKTQPQAAD